MKIYLDLVFIINFFFDFIIIMGTKCILKENVKFIRLLLATLFASSSIFLLFIPINNITLFILKFIISIIIILIAFGRRNFFKDLVYFYLVSVFLGGVLYLFDISFTYKNKGLVFFNNGMYLNFVVVLIISPIIIYLYVREMKKYKSKYSNIYNAQICINDKNIFLKAMLDTGNNLTDPYSGKSVVLVNKNIKINSKKFIYVPYKALNTSGVIKCFNVDMVIVNDKVFKNCLVGISSDIFSLEEVDCILPNSFKEDL